MEMAYLEGRILLGILAAALLPAPVGKVSVTIGGAVASILYAGAAPGFVAGPMQINVRVPSGVVSPAALVLTVGGANSQSGCTVAIK
jgi:uncharacterized protein (TIGR03437 family)